MWSDNGYSPAIVKSRICRLLAVLLAMFCALSFCRYALPASGPMVFRMVPIIMGAPEPRLVDHIICPFQRALSRSSYVLGTSLGFTMRVLYPVAKKYKLVLPQ